MSMLSKGISDRAVGKEMSVTRFSSGAVTKEM